MPILFFNLILTIFLSTTVAFPSPSIPRDTEDALDGIVHLGRCADKAELESEGRLGEQNPQKFNQYYSVKFFKC